MTKIERISKANISSPEFGFKSINETRNYLIEGLKHNDLMSEKYKKACMYLSYVEQLLILVSTVSIYLSVSAFASLLFVLAHITSSPVGI